MKRAGLLILVCCLVCLASCAPKPEAAMVGKWQRVSAGSQQTDGGPVLEFFPDGTLTETGKNKEIGWGNYKVLDATRIKLEFGTGDSESHRFTVMATLSGDELSFSDAPGPENELKYRRIK